MIFEVTEKNPGARFLFIFACLVIVVAGLKAAAPIMVPFALALFLAVVSMPVMFWMRRHRIGAPMAIFLTVGLNLLLFALVIMVGTNGLGTLNDNLGFYRSQFSTKWVGIQDWLVAFGLSLGVSLDRINEYLTTPDFLNLGWTSIRGGVVGALGAVASAFSMTFLVALISVFILAEATVFPFKFQAIFGAPAEGRTQLTKTVQEIQGFLGIKLLVSLATGLAAGLFCWAMGLDVPVLLGIVAFALNFVPTIGSIIAAVPALVLAFILHDLNRVFFVALGYFAINTLFGNIIEPNLMGRRLGLSTLVIVLSLVFWFWVWGPIGALLSVPLTMVLKIALENTPDLRWAAVLLDKVPPQARRAAEEAVTGNPSSPVGGSLSEPTRAPVDEPSATSDKGAVSNPDAQVAG